MNSIARRRTRWIFAFLGLGLLLYFLPLFHLVPLEETKSKAVNKVFDATAFVDKFWKEALPEAGADAVNANELLESFQQDFDGTAERYGHRLGLSGSASYFVSGQGTILAVDNKTVLLALTEGGPAQIAIKLGPVFGNAIRDGSGLINVSDFSNAQDFNAISADINRRVEEQVLPLFAAQAEPGTVVIFTGGVEVMDSAGPPSQLNLVPVDVEFP